MMVGTGVSSFDLSSMEKYGSNQVISSEKTDVVLFTQSQVVGLQTMFRAHRQELMLNS
jgi:hypothetical protein